jgi:hypothetical protein
MSAKTDLPLEVKAQLRLVLEDKHRQAQLGSVVKLVVGGKLSDETAIKLGLASIAKIIVAPYTNVSLDENLRLIIRNTCKDLCGAQVEELVRLLKLVPDVPEDILWARFEMLVAGRDPGPLSALRSRPSPASGSQSNLEAESQLKLVSKSQNLIIPYAVFSFLMTLAIEAGWKVRGHASGIIEAQDLGDEIWRHRRFETEEALDLSYIIEENARKNGVAIDSDLAPLINLLKQGSFRTE